MFTHIVIVVDPTRLAIMDVEDDNTGALLRVMTPRSSGNQYDTLDGDPDSWLGTQRFLFNDELTATRFATWVAQHRPGTDVYITKVSSIATTKYPEVIVREITPQGVLPQ